ncbi:hypothetical protein Tco_1483279, partial [Tanacetum coccineum]
MKNNKCIRKSEIELRCQRQGKGHMREAVDDGLVVTEEVGTKPDKHGIQVAVQGVITQGVKSISLTEADAREVHATHARIVSGPDLEPMQEDQTGSNSRKLHVSLAGPNPEHMDDEFLATAYLKVH